MMFVDLKLSTMKTQARAYLNPIKNSVSQIHFNLLNLAKQFFLV